MSMNYTQLPSFKPRAMPFFSVRARSMTRWLRLAVLAGTIVALYVLARWIEELLIDRLGLEPTSGNELILHGTIVIAVVIYVILMAVPFMPSAEIGLALLVMFGARIALLVYAATILALTLSYLLGRLIPVALLARAFGLLGITKVETFLNDSASLSASERTLLLVRDVPVRIAPFLLRHRLVGLAILLNLPGNIVIGGGGGIALIAGMSRLVPLPLYLITVALAVAPVPFLVFFLEHAW